VRRHGECTAGGMRLLPCLMLSLVLLVPACVAPEEEVASSEASPVTEIGGGGDLPCLVRPSTVTVQRTTGTSVELQVNNNCEGKLQTLERASSPNGPFTYVDEGPSPWTVVDSGRPSLTTICYRARLGSHGAGGEPSSVVCATTLEAPPAAPQLTAVYNPNTTNQALLHIWDQANNEEGYVIYYMPPGTTQWQALDTLGPLSRFDGNSATERTAQLPTGTTCFIVRAYNHGGSSLSNEVCRHPWRFHVTPPEVREWNIFDRPALHIGALFNTAAQANLVAPANGGGFFGDATRSKVRVYRNPHSSAAPIVDQEPVAIFIEGSGYLTADASLNLHFVSTPALEWRFDADDNLDIWASAGLYNILRHEYLIADASTASGVRFVDERDGELYLRPNAAQSGEYEGTISGTGKLRSLWRIGSAPLALLLPGHSDCSDPNSRIETSNNPLTASEMTRMFGSPQPQLPVTVRGCGAPHPYFLLRYGFEH
jgi:hypothetical protein